MLSISVSAIALLTTFRLVDMAIDVYATLQGTVRAIDTVHEIRFAIGQSRICTLNFSDVTLAGGSVQVTRTLYYPNPSNPTQKSSLVIGEVDKEGTIVTISGMTLRRDSLNTNLAYLDIDMRGRKAGGTLPLRRRSIPMVVQTDAANRITCCSTMEVDQCPEDINVFAPPGCNGSFCACGGSGPAPGLPGPNICGEQPPVSSNAICVSRGFARSIATTLRVLSGGETICNPNTTICWPAAAGCNACEVVTCEN